MHSVGAKKYYLAEFITMKGRHTIANINGFEINEMIPIFLYILLESLGISR